jgi:K+-transporting ATPase ATPase B chain
MTTPTSLFTGPLMAAAARDSFAKLDPRTLIRNPVMFVTSIVAALSTVLLVKGIFTGATARAFQAQLVVWLWLTVLFGNFAEAMAEGRGKAQRCRGVLGQQWIEGNQEIEVGSQDRRSCRG